MFRQRIARRRALALLPLIVVLVLSAAGAGAQGPAPATTRLHLPLLVGPQPGRSSLELIDAALERGAISAETALIYKTFAIFGDGRLPASFRGVTVGEGGEAVITQMSTSFATLSPAGQTTLLPFTIPPFHAGSWWDLANRPASSALAAENGENRFCNNPTNFPILAGWRAVDSANGKARVWWQTRYPQDEAKAKMYAELVDTVWPELSSLMGREPLRDNGSVLPCRGGDDRIDISLADISEAGYVRPYIRPIFHSPGFAVLRRSLSGTHARAVFIHELMHLFQLAFDVNGFFEYRWWVEATAEWSIHYIESRLWPGNQSQDEHQSAYSYFKRPSVHLESSEGGADAKAFYRAYLLPFFDLIKRGDGSLVRRSFERGETISDSLENLNGLLPGGFKQTWPEFTLRLLNRAPVAEFTEVDQIPHRPALNGEFEVRLDGATDSTYEMDGEVEHLASHIYHFRFSDPNVRSTLFFNPFIDENPTAAVRALVKIVGQPARVEDWTSLDSRAFCRDLKAERVEELTIVISNSEWEDRGHELGPAEPPRLNVTNVGCRGWEFKARAVRNEPFGTGTIAETTLAQGTFTLDRSLSGEGPRGGPHEMYRVSSGTATWSHQTTGPCTARDNGEINLSGGVQTLMFVWNYGMTKEWQSYVRGHRQMTGFGSEGFPILDSLYVTLHCPPNPPTEVLVQSAARWFSTENGAAVVNLDGRTIRGSARSDDGFTIYSWEMTALPPE